MVGTTNFRCSLFLALVLVGAAASAVVLPISPAGLSFALSVLLIGGGGLALSVLLFTGKRIMNPLIVVLVGAVSFASSPAGLILLALFAMGIHGDTARQYYDRPERVGHPFLSLWLVLTAATAVLWNLSDGTAFAAAIAGAIPLLLVALLEVEALEPARRDFVRGFRAARQQFHWRTPTA